MRLTSLCSFFVSLASPALAGDISLSIPIQCALGDTCYIQNFVDNDPSVEAKDFACGNLSYDAHKGTDFALRSTVDMWRGVNVLAAAPGTVVAIRDGVSDHLYGSEGAPSVEGKECGNRVFIDHGDGWTTDYCHMMNGSVAVEKGQKVKRNEKLGMVGLSGMTQFPHVHLSLRKDNEVVDPFNPTAETSCAKSGAKTLWKDTMYYQPTGLISVGITSGLPNYADVKSGAAQILALPADSPALVVYGFAFGSQAGDTMRLSLSGPEGRIAEQDVALEKDQAQYFRAIGRKASAPWPEGDYDAVVGVYRDGVLVSEMNYRVSVAQ